ncbi:ArgE/DapE family deacylase [Enterococcus raffinosus]|uniref:Probable succinyl-diaminopimelate desuccinylase n=1 Tax=Enterococcus raffinosus TaxID=71452 RepID=A0AAW8T6L5_9ENTE|nr:ArgE/DapE family deacylase [Enterococcus raffinosus]MDT2523746.1 ArgE/DapE family deacylase [Enterococcus raffinosus]MDT2529715.1 ArgE/DapE family deacylase [Enterococcus raffinosus]MDT2534273.1 ArgE/DapE family deacylase [Enterococcus raffinosus]MDT2544883.1 ArgE/DapE family deacylase [Enterococcus raffinosus]MDT2556829.1 ArgE/DapE family deacylase [Enterococcus raffinosus]
MERKEKIAILQDVIRIKSVNDNEAEVAQYFADLLKKYGIESERVQYKEGRDNLVATVKKGKSEKVLGLTGHMDVVDAGDEARWTYPPYDAVIEGNKLYGRGSTDMKSGLTAMIIAMIELEEEKSEFDGAVKLLATVGEEVGELGAQQLTKAGYADDLTGLLIGEPTNYNLLYAHMGSINYSVISYGKEAHSSMPEEGFNAINHLNQFITKVNQKMTEVANSYVNKELGRTIHNVTVIKGGNQVNSIPNYAELQGNIRSIPDFDNEKIKELLSDIVDELNEESEYKLELTIDYNKIPVQAEKNSTLIQTIQKQFDAPLPLITAAGTTDAAEFTKAKNTFDVVVFGPGVPTLPHKVDEYVEIDNYMDMIDKYKAIIKSYLA